MKSLLLTIALLSPSAVVAQDLAGAWQGTLPVGPGLRLVVKISKADAGLRAMLHSIDQGGQGLPGTVTLQGSAVKIAVPGIGGTYEGKLKDDQNSIVGSWTQGGPAAELTLVRATADTAWAIPVPPPPAKPMAADANPVFEVATIKPSRPDAQGKGIRVNGRQFSTLNTTLADLITFAYGIHARQITGAPAWVETDKFDLSAKPDGEGQPSGEQWKTMLKKLIGERFEFKFHRDKKELSVYAIVPGKSGPKLTKSESTGNLPALFFRGRGNLPARNATMTDLANVMQAAVLDRPVVDQTGLTDRYDFTLLWTPDQFQFGGAPAPPPSDAANAPPDLFKAFEDQLGLKLISAKAPAEVFVVDKVERPSEN
jgi:uncharacterized protein (TIGR03435 family)